MSVIAAQGLLDQVCWFEERLPSYPDAKKILDVFHRAAFQPVSEGGGKRLVLGDQQQEPRTTTEVHRAMKDVLQAIDQHPLDVPPETAMSASPHNNL